MATRQEPSPSRGAISCRLQISRRTVAQVPLCDTIESVVASSTWWRGRQFVDREQQPVGEHIEQYGDAKDGYFGRLWCS